MTAFGQVSINPAYAQRIGKLCEALEENHISFELCAIDGTNGFMVVFPNTEHRTGDVILHDGSYGHYSGGFEGYQNMSTNPDDVCVFETIVEVVEQAKKQGYAKSAE